MATLPDIVFQHLIAQGICRDPRVAGGLPPAFRMPADGVPAPGEGSGTEVGPTAVVGIFQAPGLPSPFLEAEHRWDQVDVVFRTLKWPATVLLHAQVRAALVDRMGGTLAGMRIISVSESRTLQPLDSSTAQGWMSSAAFMIESYASDHY